MPQQAEIPCASCRSWVKKHKKFSCNPDQCRGLTEWIFTNAPQLSGGSIKMPVILPECATQYVV